MKLILNGEEKEYAPPLTVEQLVALEGFRPDRIALERNGEIVPKVQYAQTSLCDGDKIEIVSFVGGG